jgi:prepilin-type N-terminal cleavage/methylation domain-containing protein
MKKPHFMSSQKGFTLVELLSVIVIIGILAGLVAGGIQFANQKVAREKAKSQIKLLSSALEEFKIDNGFYPASGADADRSTAVLIISLGYLNPNNGTTTPPPKIYLDSLDTTTKTNEKGKTEFVNNKQGWLNIEDNGVITAHLTVTSIQMLTATVTAYGLMAKMVKVHLL